MIHLVVLNLRWIKPGDQPTDMCAHGDVELIIDGHTLGTVEDGEWCVSAAAVHLLRTLTESHTEQSPVAEHLIPCCGPCIIPPDDPDGDVTFMECNQGIDWQIIRNEDKDNHTMILPDGHIVTVKAAVWRTAVIGFVDAVKAFYSASAPKQPFDDWEKEGFSAMMAEWDRRRRMAADGA